MTGTPFVPEPEITDGVEWVYARVPRALVETFSKRESAPVRVRFVPQENGFVEIRMEAVPREQAMVEALERIVAEAAKPCDGGYADAIDWAASVAEAALDGRSGS